MEICRIPILLASICLLSSCASVSVDRVASIDEGKPEGKPDKIFVKPFVTEDANLRVDRGQQDLKTFEEALGTSMQEQLIAYLSKSIAPAEPAGKKLPRGNYWLVEGEFVRVNQGSRALRSVVGYGFGGTKMEAVTTVSSLRNRKPQAILRVETVGGSNLSPGALGIVTFPISGPMALTSLVGLVDGFRSGISFDMHRTAREITAALSEELHHAGHLPNEEVIRAKRSGQLPDSIWPTERPTPESDSE